MASVQKLLCDHCNRMKADVFYDDDTDTAMCEDCRIQRAKFAAHFDAKQPAEDFQAHVASMEASVSNAWVETEWYSRRVFNGFNHRTEFLRVECGIVNMHYFVPRGQSKSVDLQSGQYVGCQTWGLKLRQSGWRKGRSTWHNSMTGEYTHFNPKGE